MPKRSFGFLLVLLFVLGLFACPGLEAEKELSLSLIIPPKHLRYINVLQPWSELIQEKTGGKVKLTPYFAAAIAPPPQTFESTVKGIADISEGIVYATPGQFPLTEVIMVPELGIKNAVDASKVMWKAYNEVPELNKEWQGAKVLWIHVNSGLKLITRNKPVHKLEDLKGLKIRVSGATAAKMGKALGFTPVSMPMGDLYMGLEKGVIDGVVLPSEILVSRRLGEVAKYVTNIDLGHDPFYVVMNQATWEDLSPEVKKVFEQYSGAWAVEFTGKAWDKFDAEAEAINKKNGIKYIELSDAEKARWKNLLVPIADAYAGELEAKKLPGKKVLKMFRNASK